MPDAACSPTSPSKSATSTSDEVLTNSPRPVTTTIDPMPTTAVVETEAAMSQTTRSLVTYCSTKVQTVPPPNAAAFEQTYGRPATMADLERRVGLAGNGRYSGPDDTLHGAIIGTVFEYMIPEKKFTYAESGFQTTSFQPMQKALLKAKMKAAKTAKTFKDLAADDGYHIWAEANDGNVVHSEQFGFDIVLDDTGNAPADRDLTGHFLRNIYKEEMTTKLAREAMTAASKATSVLPPPPPTFALTQPLKSTVQRTSRPPRPIPSLAPAEMVVTEDTPAQKAAKEKAAKEAAEKEKATEETTQKNRTSQENGTEEKIKAEKPPGQDESVEQSSGQQSTDVQPSDDEVYDYYQHEEGGNPYLEPEETDSAYSYFETLIVFDPDQPTQQLANPVHAFTSPTKVEEQDPQPPNSRKRKAVPRKDAGDNKEIGNSTHNRLQTMDVRSSAAQYAVPRFAEYEPASGRSTQSYRDYATQSHKPEATHTLKGAADAQRKPLLQNAERPDIPRGPRRDTRRRSISRNRKPTQDDRSAARGDRREVNHIRRRSRSPERRDGETSTVTRERGERTIDSRRAEHTYREFSRGTSVEGSRYPSDTQHGAPPIADVVSRDNIVDVHLSQAGMPTPPESNKSTPPRTTPSKDDTDPAVAQTAGRTKYAKQASTHSDTTHTGQADPGSHKHSTATRRRDDAIDGIALDTKPRPSNANLIGIKLIQGESDVAQKTDTVILHGGQKRARDPENNLDEKVYDDQAKRAKKDLKGSSSRSDRKATVRAYSYDDSEEGAIKLPAQHMSAPPGQKSGEGAKVIHESNKEDIDKQGRLEAEQKLRDVKAKIAERHAKRASRGRGGAEMQRFVPSRMRQSANDDGADTDQRGGQRGDHRGRRR